MSCARYRVPLAWACDLSDGVAQWLRSRWILVELLAAIERGDGWGIFVLIRSCAPCRPPLRAAPVDAVLTGVFYGNSLLAWVGDLSHP